MFFTYSSKCNENNHYIVKTGDTLYSIAKLYNISMDAVVEANPETDPGNLAPGHSILIPLAVPVASCPIGATAYTIQQGDDFYSIARRFRIHLSPLLKANPGINPDALLIGQRICIPAISSIYTNADYGIKFEYPYLWSKIDAERYEGIDGFFQVSAISSDESLEEVCSSEAHHSLKPYGTQPDISIIRSGGNECRMVIPSPDQLHEMRGQSALILKYHVPIEIKGKSCSYLIILTDKNHIKDIADTLELIK